MKTISVRLDDQDTRLIKEYAKTKNITISTLVRDAVLDRIEDEIDLQLYHDSMEAHRKKSKAISFDDMMKGLVLNRSGEWRYRIGLSSDCLHPK
jgi:predicted DNA-binding protein